MLLKTNNLDDRRQTTDDTLYFESDNQAATELDRLKDASKEFEKLFKLGQERIELGMYRIDKDYDSLRPEGVWKGVWDRLF